MWIDNPIETTSNKDPKDPDRPKSHKLKAGMICHVKLPIGQSRKVMLVHKDAVVLGGQGRRVFVVDSSVTPPVGKPVAVEFGSTTIGNFIQVIGDLKPGMPIVIRGNERLMPNQPLNIVKEEK